MKRLLCFLMLTAVAAAQNYPDITAQQLKPLLGRGVVVLDCNGSDAYVEGHIPGSIDYLGGYLHLKRLLPANKNALIVAYCGGNRCPMYKLGADDARRLGYRNIKHLSSGLQGWKELGYPVTTR